MDWNEQFDATLDFPPGDPPLIRYAICSTPRSGSHFLGQLLFATGMLGCPLEYFNGRNVVRWRTRADTAGELDLVAFLEGIRTSPNGCFGVKAHYPHLRTLAQHCPLAEFASQFAHIHIVRRDRLAQAVSFARAEQTDEWISRSASGGRTAVYDSQLIRRCLIEIGRQNASWDYFFHAFGIRPLLIEYETLAVNPAEAVRQVAGFVGIDLPAYAPMPAPRTSKQRDPESDLWRDRFVDESRRVVATAADLDVLQHTTPAHLTGRHRWKRWVETALRV
jgi:LPS sulfotransferase NodH